MSRPEPVACIGITPTALTVTVDGKPVLVIPRERMLDLMVRIGIALREVPDCGGSLPPQGSKELKLAAGVSRPAINAGQSADYGAPPFS